MIGNNELHLNDSTMIDAMQMYLDAKMVKAPRVISVKQVYEHSVGTFIVRISDAET